MANDTEGLETVTLVPVAITPRRKERAVTPELFRFDEVTRRTYLAGTNSSLPAAG